MKYLFIFIIFFLLFTSFLPSVVFAAPTPLPCTKDDKRVECVFGVITPPPAIQTLIGKDTTGAQGISKFLSNFVVLIYSISAIVLLFMILWGAFDWMISEGDKEKLANAQKKIINAFIGILILAIAFAVIAVLGQFTGFQFFRVQKEMIIERDSSGTVTRVVCRNGTEIGYGDTNLQDPAKACEPYD